MPSREELPNVREELHKECSRALEYYIRLVRQSCEVLGEIKEPVIAPATRDKIFSQRKEEVAAYGTFMAARRRLWRFLSDGLTPARMTDIPPRKRPSNKPRKRALEEIDRLLG
jgi:hypothetical protein